MADIRTPASQLASIQPNALHPVTHSFSAGQSEYWQPPNTAWQLELHAGTNTGFGMVYEGEIEGDVTWLRTFGFADQQQLDGSGGTVALFLSEGDSAPTIRISASVSRNVRVYRMALGTRRDITGAISPQSLPPQHGLRTDFHSTQIKSGRNIFLGRQDQSAGETGRLLLTHVPQDDPAFTLRRQLIVGDAIAELPDSGAFNGESFYCWSDGRLPEPVLGQSLRWSVDLPIRYWSA